MPVQLVTSFRSWADLQARGWGRLVRSGSRYTFVPRDDPRAAVDGVVGAVHPVLAPIFEHLLSWLVAHRGRPLDKTGNWGGSIRPIRGREAQAYAGVLDAWSNHSGLCAIDIEAPRNPLGAYGRGDFPPGWEDECHRWGCAWGASTRDGGDYVSRPDRMHIEFIGTYEQALAYRALLAEGGDPTPTTPGASTPFLEEDSMDLPASETPRSQTLVVPTDARALVISLGWTAMTAEVAFFGSTPPKGAAAVGKRLGPLRIEAARPWEIPVPPGAVTAEVNYTLGPVEGRDVHAVAGFRR